MKKISQKGIIEILTQRVNEVMSLLPIKQSMENELRKQYMRGLNRIDKQFKPEVNITLPGNANRQLEALYNYSFQNLQSHADEIGNKLRQELQRGLLNGDNSAQLADRVKDVFKDKKYQSRMKMVLRTESIRANNTAALEATKQIEQETGAVIKKYLDVTMDDRTTETCKEENKKYGTKEKAIPLDSEFVYIWQNKTFRAQNPPFHPNCRTVVLFTREGEL